MKLIYDDPGLAQKYEAEVSDGASSEDVGRAAFRLALRANDEDPHGTRGLTPPALVEHAWMWTHVEGVPLAEEQRPLAGD
jgi:hypothetical protein